MQNHVNILTMKWGKIYSAEYVNKLYSMVACNLNIPFKFICFTDDKSGIRDEVISCNLPDVPVRENYSEAGWRKLSMLMSNLEDLKGMALFLDLDLVIVDNIDCFFEIGNKKDFYIIENWTQIGQDIGNSSVYRFEIGAMNAVYEEYINDPAKCFKDYDNEQIFLCRSSRKNGININYWPSKWCKSFKRHCISSNALINWIKSPTLPEYAKIIVFHGYPKPDQAAIGGCTTNKFWRWLRPATWIKKYWI